MQTDKERIAELEAEVRMLAVAAKAARAADAASGGKPPLTRRALEALPVDQRLAAVRSHQIVD